MIQGFPTLNLLIKSQIVDAVKSFGKKNKYLVKKCVLFGYGFPLLIPSLAFLMDFLMKKYVSFPHQGGLAASYYSHPPIYRGESKNAR